MTEPVEFDIINSPIDGRNLIEAGAGTGKTYTISRIFLRLLLERQLEISSILVVTFTEAATEELRRRIRIILQEAKYAFETLNTGDKLIKVLLARCEKKRSLDIINASLRDFDTVAIYTIHGFCSSILRKNAFECNQTFDAEVITDQSGLFEEIADDFWRKNFPCASQLFVTFVLKKKLTPQKLFHILRPFCTLQPKLATPLPLPVDTSTLESDFIDSVNKAAGVWNKSGIDIEAILLSGNLDGRKYNVNTIKPLFTELDHLFKSSTPSPLLFTKFENFTASSVSAATKKNKPCPSHDFFDLCEELLKSASALADAFNAKILRLQSEFLSYSKKELANRKEKQNVLYFDDLLHNVYKALTDNKNDCRLADETRREFKAALIDEFQDTDPIQYGIFNTIFNAGSTLFLIGDPKQAIYGFRGADIFAYLKAAASIDRKYTLRTNYRSDKGLVIAVNSIFSARSDSFVYKDIAYHNIRSGVVQKNNAAEGSLELWILPRDGSKTAIPKAAARPLITNAVASGISNLLASKELIGNKIITPSDIAVLVRKNPEAGIIKDALTAIGIPAVIDSAENVFSSQEATDMYRLLTAIHEVSNPQLCRAAMATAFFGCNAGQIIDSVDNEKSEDRLTGFHDYHDLWNSEGFIRMMRALMGREKVRAKILKAPGGERALTNILHLTELLHKEESRVSMTPGSLCAWLSVKISDLSSHVPDEEMLRLESDGNAVRIMTIHKSKGLEFPVVFCPFSWDGAELSSKAKNFPFIFHDPAADFDARLALDPATMELNRSNVGNEMLSENIRLLYVALTRAKNRCCCVWGMISGAETSALAWLLNCDPNVKNIDSLKARCKFMSDDEALLLIKPVIERSGGNIKTVMIGKENALPYKTELVQPEKLKCATFNAKIPEPWVISSFSSLSGKRHSQLPDLMQDFFETDDIIYNSNSIPVSDTKKLSGINEFPRGALAGTFFHDILQHIDFSNVADRAAENLVDKKLLEYGFDISWNVQIKNFLDNLVKTPVTGIPGGFSLNMIRPDSCLKETEFYFPLKRITQSQINDLFLGSQTNDLFLGHQNEPRFEFSPVRGFMKGFMDCIFDYENKYYLVDWKSNYLGESLQDYCRSALQTVMMHEGYNLQYHIYLTALNAFFSLRDKQYSYEKKFGGVIYVFLRGISPENIENGIFFHKPEKNMILRLSEMLLEQETT
jgi:exodeoxyribonuclease V beta subunit